MDPALLLIWPVMGAIGAWLAGRFIGGNRITLLVLYISGAVIGSWLLPRLGLVIFGGLIGEITNQVLGISLLALPINLVVRRIADGREPSSRRAESIPPQPTAISRFKARTRASGKIFISYRRSDSHDVTGRLYDRLVKEFGETSVFRDLDSVPIGLDFRKYIDDTVSTCDVCLVVIGKDLIRVSDASGKRRIDDPKDHVRIEIEAALKRTIPVVPILVGGADMPTVDELPPSLQDLAFRNGVPLRPDPDFHRDVDRLVAGLKRK